MAHNGTANGFSLSSGAPETFVMKLIDRMGRQGNWPALIQNFVSRQEISPHMFTPQVRQAMIEHLIERGVVMDDQVILVNGGYDEHFAVAYEHARDISSATSDPLNAALGEGKDAKPWDFTVRTFSEFEAQGVITENILAAGAIDYIYELGERMGIYKLADALVLQWASGAIDVADGTAANRLFRYWKRRDERSSAEERGMLYKRVLNKGGANVLERMVVNEQFPVLWRNLMTEVADYINKSEKLDDGRSSSSPVSRSSVYQAIRELQYNLTEYSTGMAHMQSHELYSQLTDALDILDDPEIMAHFGGTRRKSMWTVIEKLSKSELNRSIPIGPTLRMAVDGNRVFRAISAFEEGLFTDQDFSEFIDAAESYILNSAVAGDEPQLDEDDDDFGEFDDFEEDEFADEDF